jgi:FKBP-type peptidyl-prolyl cis-trans isomerase
MTRTSSGLYYEDIEAGTGEPTAAGQDVQVAYAGWLKDGTEFDRGQFGFRLGAGQVVPGFDEGVAGMRVGGTRRIIIPPDLGYGARGSGPIPPNSILVFRIELLSIV